MGANLQPWSTFGVLLWPDSAKSSTWKCQWNRLQMNLGGEMTKSHWTSSPLPLQKTGSDSLHGRTFLLEKNIKYVGPVSANILFPVFHFSSFDYPLSTSKKHTLTYLFGIGQFLSDMGFLLLSSTVLLPHFWLLTGVYGGNIPKKK